MQTHTEVCKAFLHTDDTDESETDSMNGTM